MALKIYIETTISSFYFEARKNAECISRRNWTGRWSEKHRHEHQLVTSLVVRDELSDPSYPESKRRNALALMNELSLLDLDPQIDQIVLSYVENLLMPQQPVADAVHLAIVSFYQCDILLTWNCVHLANPNKFGHIANINKRLNLSVPAVITPLELLGEM